MLVRSNRYCFKIGFRCGSGLLISLSEMIVKHKVQKKSREDVEETKNGGQWKAAT
jgi:hypothetical protein